MFQMYAFCYPVMLLFQWKYQLVSNRNLMIGIGVTLIPFGNALCGYFAWKCGMFGGCCFSGKVKKK